ncbi:MAG: hypothetical protein WB998_05855 [Solirubrobacteraceae bacterium]
MLELITTLVDVITRVLPAITRTNSSKRKRELGSDLFVLYVQLNEIYIAGQLIIGQIEKYVPRMTECDDPAEYSFFLDWLRSKLQAQSGNLARVGVTMEHFAIELQVVDPDAYADLIILLYGKVTALDALMIGLERGILPLGSTKRDFETFLNDVRPGNPYRNTDRKLELIDLMYSVQLDTTGKFTHHVPELLTQYLAAGKPAAQLEAIHDALAQMRKSLLTCFTLEEIILDVGDHRLSIISDPHYLDQLTVGAKLRHTR